MNNTSEFSFYNWALGFAGCDGGDIGNNNEQSIWFCGIEWGGGFDTDISSLKNIFDKNLEKIPEGYDNWEENISYIYNWQAMKLFSVIHNYELKDYKKFAEDKKPFVKKQKGFFKLNLYPIAFKNTSHDLWEANFSEATNLKTKQDYISWIKENRFPVMNKWVKDFSPKLIICTGITYFDDFKRAFSDNNAEFNKEKIENHELLWSKNDNGTKIVIIPFMVNRYGLTKNQNIEKFGQRINEILNNY
ncbi:hypothetical protein [Aliarcobacter butzleri]|uniref:hypothetical protein n=1 Tax=Aliarcobacter butzleri TaxID=28197 RepID=UPI0021B5B042|nr:hypothetical protein [Aliarcobacter butzleri]MCT7644585.1 hypothetical protein [Aliarcobacter butzleri]